jgi:glycosyltransferase involved in cell wall biosynthesis
MLLTDGFGGIGGIAKFNRDFLEALDSSGVVERVRALPRLIVEPIDGTLIPEAVVYDRAAAGGKPAFIRRVFAQLFRGNAANLVICGHINLLPAAWLLARVQGAGLILMVHGIEAWKAPRSVFTRRLAGKVDAVVAVSRLSAERFCAWSKIPLDRTFILPAGVDLDQFRAQERDVILQKRYGLQSSRVIMTMGRLESRERYKGFDEVIGVMPRLLKRFPDLKYLIVGDGPDRQRLEGRVAELGLLENVIFTGYISESEKVAHYNLADAYVMPSNGEGFGIVLIEAAACGIPVVGSNADGSREALLDGQLGTLVDPKKPDEVAEAIIAVFDRPRERRRLDGIDSFSLPKFKFRVADWCGNRSFEVACLN